MFHSPAFDAFAAVQSNQTTIHAETDLQTIAVRVTDKQGNDVQGLTAENFVVLEEGRPQKIAFFGAQSVPTSLVVLVDSSSSMDPTDRLGSAETIAARFLRSAHPGDEISAMNFSDQIGLFQALTLEQIVSSPSIPLAGVTRHGSALYDAIATTLCHLRASQTHRQAIVVISDGVGQHSRITLEQLVGLVQKSSRVQLFMIGLNSRSKYNFGGKQGSKMTLVTGHEIDNPVYVFDLLASVSGAEAHFLKSEDDIGLALQHVEDVLRAQYTIAYYLQASPKSLRKLEVRANLPGLRVASCGTVGSINAARESVYFTEGTSSISAEHHPYPFESKLTKGPRGWIYHEDFSDPRSGWPNRAESFYDAGRYEMRNAPPSINSVAAASEPIRIQQDVLAAYGPWWQNFRASVVLDSRKEEISSPPPTSSLGAPLPARPSAGLIFRLNDEGYYALVLSIPRKGSDPSFTILKREYRATAPVEIIRWTRIQVPQTRGLGTKISVECIGGQIRVFVNDQEVGRAADPSYAQGYAGLVVSGHSRAVFRDLVVEEIP